ncbi:hypothetical protein QBC38DRAFT_495608 [Podospora fimiseda]|uniref:Uncharacterized protein n=1 Tax=Podospora fimiseda TaxID=252190 RepID=A0AAN7BYE5_9PEZI|nr:hypothetical protein QBC38DRAFT_495608 [Podospora fimiseda]
MGCRSARSCCIGGPYLALKSAQSDREQALRKVDSGSTGYVQELFKIADSLYLRRVRVPVLHVLPNELGGPKLKDSITADSVLPELCCQSRQRGYSQRQYGRSKTAANVFGITGAIWWRQTLRTDESRFDEFCFAPHADTLQESALHDPTPLDELFWLAVGCLPVRGGDGKIERVLDLRFEVRGPSRITPSRRTALRAHHSGAVFKQRPSPSARYLQWAIAMGAGAINHERIYYLDILEGQEASEAYQYSRAPMGGRLLHVQVPEALHLDGCLVRKVGDTGWICVKEAVGPLTLFQALVTVNDLSERFEKISELFEQETDNTLKALLVNLEANIRKTIGARDLSNITFSRERATLSFDLISHMEHRS